MMNFGVGGIFNLRVGLKKVQKRKAREGQTEGLKAMKS